MTSRFDHVPAAWIAVAALLGVVVIAVAAGTRSTEYDPPLPVSLVPKRSPASADARPARSYRELFVRPWSERASEWEKEVAALEASQPPPVIVSTADANAKRAALEGRAMHRAFDGAPPTIPHAVRQGAAPECLACHATGMRIGDAVARPISHPPYVSCTQCHVVESSPVPSRSSSDVGLSSNTFVGLAAATAPYRWTSSAPPQMPHTTLMRDTCTSCHGIHGREGLMSTHLERRNCPQCHTPSANLDQRAMTP